MKSCHRCGQQILLAGTLQRTDACPACQSDLKCCLNCRFFDRAVNNQCAEPQAEWCPEKEKANFCEFFEFRETTSGDPAGGHPPKERAKARFDDLFKKP